MTENEMVGWHHPLNGHEFEQAQGASEGQSLVGCRLWGRTESDVTQQQQQQQQQQRVYVTATPSVRLTLSFPH